MELYMNAENITYFNSSGDEHIPKEIMKFNGNKNIVTKIFIIKAYDSRMCGFHAKG